MAMKGFASSYLLKHQLIIPKIVEPPSEKVGFIVVIPVLCEPDLIQTLESLWNCRRPSCYVEVLIVINEPENADPDITDCNFKTATSVTEWIRHHQEDSFKFLLLQITLPTRDAGVGLARKTGMDEALIRFSETGNNRGFILSFDADSTCDSDYFTEIEKTVTSKPATRGFDADSTCDSDYFSEIEKTVTSKPATRGFDVYFEHPLEGSEYPEKIYAGIAQYELHLRYVNLYLKHTGFPYAFHTIGSCFGVRADNYAEQGGMNRRKGGEDFYFLHKIIPLGNFEVVNTTRVIPSPRDSVRVPFGTGPVIRRYMNTGAELVTYNPETFRILRQFITLIPQFYRISQSSLNLLIDQLPAGMPEFLNIIDLKAAIQEINNNSGSPQSFRNRFFRWFDAFRVIKYLNYSSVNHYPKLPVTAAVLELLNDLNYDIERKNNAAELLTLLREIERK